MPFWTKHQRKVTKLTPIVTEGLFLFVLFGDNQLTILISKININQHHINQQERLQQLIQGKKPGFCPEWSHSPDFQN